MNWAMVIVLCQVVQQIWTANDVMWPNGNYCALRGGAAVGCPPKNRRGTCPTFRLSRIHANGKLFQSRNSLKFALKCRHRFREMV